MVYPLEFCPGLTNAKNPMLIMGLSLLVTLMLIVGFVGVTRGSRILRDLYVFLYIVVGLGSITAIAFSYTASKNFAKTLEQCLAHKLGRRWLSSDFLNWFQQKFKCCGVDNKEDWGGYIPLSCLGKPTDIDFGYFKVGCREQLSKFISAIAGIFIGGIFFWLVLLPLVLRDMTRPPSYEMVDTNDYSWLEEFRIL
ncbi:hypothetical protein RF11_13363 [Thelohanellus kitauei]|uniref:Tetraspanin n=1 Tax=Thelohanellus kitauei TaxID=669202 RepID=A0A0C2MM00_THEKT|nr:hypothetical protein RF11_13363 [Thelohanellus kitauei]